MIPQKNRLEPIFDVYSRVLIGIPITVMITIQVPLLSHLGILSFLRWSFLLFGVLCTFAWMSQPVWWNTFIESITRVVARFYGHKIVEEGHTE